MNINIKKELNNKNFLIWMKLFLKNKKSLNKGFIRTLSLLLKLKSKAGNFIFERINLIKSVFKHYNRSKRTRVKLVSGFTLVELLVTITIFVIITGVVLVNSNKFDSVELLKNFTYDTALTIKQAQSYGVNVRENILGSFNTNLSGYGVYFNIDRAAGAGGSNRNFVLFNDISANNGMGDPDKIYNDSVTSCSTDNLECVQKYTIKKGLYIKNICVGATEDTCDPNVTKLSILFYRPNLGANIYMNNDSAHPQSYAKITLSSVDGVTSSVVVTSVGQIYVKK